MKNCNDKNECGGRREFLVKASAIAGGVMLSLSGMNATSGQTTDSKSADTAADDLILKLDSSSALSKIGGSQVFETKSGSIIVIHTGDMNFNAFSAICTHKGGKLQYDAASKQLVCPLHGSKFDSASGSVVKGPAKTNLPAYTANDAVVISLKQKS